jgi:hypothetical protein
MSHSNKQWEILNLDLPAGKCEYDFDDYKFKKNNGTNTIAILHNDTEERPSLLWEGNATRLQDILLLYGFFARKLTCLKEDYCEDKRFYRPPARKGINFSNPWGEVRMALGVIKEWKGKKHQREILAFHYFLAFRTERFQHLKFAIFGIYCELNRKWKDQEVWGKFLNISQDDFELIMACWRRLRNLSVHDVNYTRTVFIEKRKKKEKYFKLTSSQIRDFNEKVKDEAEFEKFIGDSLTAVDSLLTYYFANLFGCLSLDHPPVITDIYYSCLKSYFKSCKSAHKENFVIYRKKCSKNENGET